MKTFKKFILEARKAETDTVNWWGKGREKASQKVAQLRKERNPQKMATALKKIAQITKAIKDKDIRHEKSKPAPSTATRMQRTGRMRKNTGYATFRDTPTSSVGTESGVDRTGVHDLRQGGRRTGSATAPGEVVAGRHGKVTGGAGTRVSRSGGTVGRKG
jgi:hypothetical protein